MVGEKKEISTDPLRGPYPKVGDNDYEDRINLFHGELSRFGNEVGLTGKYKYGKNPFFIATLKNDEGEAMRKKQQQEGEKADKLQEEFRSKQNWPILEELLPVLSGQGAGKELVKLESFYDNPEFPKEGFAELMANSYMKVAQINLHYAHFCLNRRDADDPDTRGFGDTKAYFEQSKYYLSKAKEWESRVEEK